MKNNLLVEKNLENEENCLVSSLIFNNPVDKNILLTRKGISIIGIWCLVDTSSGLLCVKREDLRKTKLYNKDNGVGVLVVSEEIAFIIAPHNDISAPWSVQTKDENFSVRLKCENNSVYCTQRILKIYEGKFNIDRKNKYIKGAPAAEFCHNYLKKEIKHWQLPTISQFELISKYFDEINMSFLTMDLPTLKKDLYWTSIENSNKHAFFYNLYTDKYYYLEKWCSLNVRAVYSLHSVLFSLLKFK